LQVCSAICRAPLTLALRPQVKSGVFFSLLLLGFPCLI
jgi:hypothetical protein